MVPWLSPASPPEEPRGIDVGRERGASIRHRFRSEPCWPRASTPPRDVCDPTTGRDEYSAFDRTRICTIFGDEYDNARLGTSPGAMRGGHHCALPRAGSLPGNA